MSNNLGFKRKFFILKREYSNMRNLNPKGHGKLELRNNRLSVSINIDNAEKDQFYNTLLIGDNKVYELGKIHTDNSHSGKGEFDFNYKDIESMGFPLEKINGILILRDTNILLGGYLDKGDSTLENYMAKLDKKVPQRDIPTVAKVDDTVPEQVEVEQQVDPELPLVSKISAETNTESPIEQDILEEPVSEEKYIKNDLFAEDTIPQENYPLVSEEVEPVLENAAAIEHREYPDELELQEIHSPISEDQYIPLDEHTIQEEIAPKNRSPESPTLSVTEEEYHKALQEMFNGPNVDFQEEEVEYIDVDTQKKLNQKNQTTNYVLNILSFFPYIEPFKIDLMGYNWWKIEIDDPKEDKGFLPYFSYISGGNHKYPLVQNTVTATALMRKHGHYLFGLYNVNDEVKFYVYGVPGSFTAEDHPQKGTTGFNTWYEGRDSVGYWLLYIDPLTGRIIYPINPMIPKD